MLKQKLLAVVLLALCGGSSSIAQAETFIGSYLARSCDATGTVCISMECDANGCKNLDPVPDNCKLDGQSLVCALPTVSQEEQPLLYTAPPVSNSTPLVSKPDSRMAQITRLLKARMAQWKAAKITNYSYTLQYAGFLSPDATTPIKIVVKNGKVVSALTESLSSEADSPVPVDATARALTVEQLFAKIQDAIKSKVAKIEVKYGASGMPVSIYVDVSTAMADDETAITATNFVPVKASRTLLK